MRLNLRTIVGTVLCLAVVLVAWGCRSSRRPPPPRPYVGYGPPIAPTPFMTAPAPPPLTTAAPQPTVSPTSPPPSATKLVAKARPALSVSTLQDPAIVLVSIQGEDGYLANTDSLGKEKLKLDKVRFTVKIEGAQDMTITASGLSTAVGEVDLRGHAAMALRIDETGVSLIHWMNQQSGSLVGTAPWENALPVAPFSVVGKYEVSVSVELPLATGKRVVNAAPVSMQRRVRGRSTTTIAGIEKIARAAAVIHLNKIGRAADKDKLQPTLLSVDLPDKNNQRLVRFWLPEGTKWKIVFLEVVVERNGTIVKVRDQERFTCVANGTRIDGEHGLVAVQDLSPGDRVWSLDLARGRRVLSEVTGISAPRLAATMLLAGRLRVTGTHPIYADGAWVRAADLAPGAELVSADGSLFSLDAIDRDFGTAQVYDISVTWPHNYFAEGILVHNKKLILSPARLDPVVVLWERAIGAHDLLKPGAG